MAGKKEVSTGVIKAFKSFQMFPVPEGESGQNCGELELVCRPLSAVGLSGAALGEPEGIPRPRRHKAKGQLFVVRDLQAASCQGRARGVSESPIEDSAIGAHKTFGPKATTEALEMAVLPTPTWIF